MMMPSTATVVNARTCDQPRSSGLASTESTSTTVSIEPRIRSWFPHVPRRECLTHEHHRQPHAVPASTSSATWCRADIEAGTFGGRVQTRFPPEPNGYLHIGHAKAICVDYGIAAEFGGVCNLRFDDTNPDTEDIEFAELDHRRPHAGSGSRPGEPLYASDYFEQLYLWAEHLVTRRLGLRRRPGRRHDLGPARWLRQARHREPVPQPIGRREPRPAAAHARRRVRRRRPQCCAPRSTCRTRTCSCATR